MAQNPKVFSADLALRARLSKRANTDALRKLTFNKHLIDLCSNDYLGFARSAELCEQVSAFHPGDVQRLNGATGSRLLSGNSQLAEDMEQAIAGYHRADTGLLFNSGYDANVGFFSAVAARGDAVLYDERIHASVRDGVRLSFAMAYSFRHNDLNHLEERLKLARGTVFVAVESVYSMDGDRAPLKELAALCEQYDANLVVDEAHATGVIGEGGKGGVVEAGIENKTFARMHTFGKALGCHGAIILGSGLLRDFLINFSRSLIYTTALPVHHLAAIKCAYSFLEKSGEKRTQLQRLVQLYQSEVNLLGIPANADFSPIQCIIFPGNTEVKRVARSIQEAGYDVRPILSPTVPAGMERLRICFHAFNTAAEIKGLIRALQATTSLQIHAQV